MLTMFAAVALVGSCSDDSTGIPTGLEVYTATLNGANEAPTAVTTTATGHAVVTVLGDSVVSWEVIIDSPIDRDRKSTRLNSSHDQISYAVFCLKKKKKKK